MKYIFTLLAIFGLSAGVSAQEILIDKKETVSVMKADGWKPKLVFGASYSQNSRTDVIGQENGDDISLGLKIDGGLDFRSGQHEWRQELMFNAASTKTSTSPKKFIKSADSLSYQSLYLYELEKHRWIGPYFRLKAETSAFKGEDIRATDHEYVDASSVVLNSGTTSFKLTDGFKPLTTRESIGAFFKIIDKKMQKLEIRFGIGAVQVDADGQFTVAAVDSAATTPRVTVSELKSYDQTGAEFAADYAYQFDEKTKFSFKAELFQPISPDLADGDEREDSELLDELYIATVTSKTYDWMSVSLEAKYQKQPQLQEAIQKQVSLLLTFTHTLF